MGEPAASGRLLRTKLQRQWSSGAEAPPGDTAHCHCNATAVSGPCLRPRACTALHTDSRFLHIESNLERAPPQSSCKMRWTLPGFANFLHRQLETLCVSQGVKVSGRKTRSRNTVHCKPSGAGLVCLKPRKQQRNNGSACKSTCHSA